MDISSIYLILGALLFSIGTFGMLIRRNAIVMLMCVELMLNAVNLSLVALSSRFNAIDGQVFVFFVLAVAAAETAVGLAIIIAIYRNFTSIQSGDLSTLRG
jgi:NADH-quinone oxidoreductase subunit K